MEKTNSNKTDGMFDETTQMTKKWMTDTCSAMMNMYDKQLKATLGFYNNLFNSFSMVGKESQEHENGFVFPFMAGNELLKSMPFGFSKSNSGLANFFITQFEDMYTQTREFNNRLFAILQEEFKNKQTNWSDLKEKYNKIFEDEWKSTQKIINNLTETYSKQLSSSIESNKKLMQEMNTQFEQAGSRNKKIWDDFAKTTQMQDNKQEKENEFERKDGQLKKNKGELAHH